MSGPVLSGLDRLVADGGAALRGQRLGLLVHPASVDGRLRHAVALLLSLAGLDVRCLFGPQHGILGQTQDNMIEWEGFRDPVTGLPVHSLYGDVRKPTPQMLADIDTLVIDLQDVGARYYTFAWTMLLCLEACAEAGKRVVILDRPNPIGGVVREGSILDDAYRSFVGMAPIPMRHGLTLGELAIFCRANEGLDLEMDVIWMEGWRRRMWFDQTGLPWVLPSPNMPTLDTALVYPGFCLLEGTNLSEGRGTTRPFEICGAPWLDGPRLAARLAGWDLPGCLARPLAFQPAFQKHAGQRCGGVQVHVTDLETFRPVLAAVSFLAAAREQDPEAFAWKQPPYEYESERLPIDILAGGPALRQALEADRPPREIAAGWEADLARFTDLCSEHLHYG
jgi:uncharacterized protein YbbC (DUF1343 family)